MENYNSPLFEYAGFWKRFAAYIIDQIILGIVQFILFVPLWIFFGVGVFSMFEFDKNWEYSTTVFAFQHYSEDVPVAAIFMIITLIFVAVIISVVVQWLYYALMESSARQATLGKMALNLKVTDMNGGRIRFGKATGRYFGKILSGLILNIGYIMAAFTEKKQALHDMLAGCLVIVDRKIN